MEEDKVNINSVSDEKVQELLITLRLTNQIQHKRTVETLYQCYHDALAKIEQLKGEKNERTRK